MIKKKTEERKNKHLQEAKKKAFSDHRWQVEAVGVIWKALHEKNVPVSLVLPTGGGKTRVANEIIVRWLVQHGS